MRVWKGDTFWSQKTTKNTFLLPLMLYWIISIVEQIETLRDDKFISQRTKELLRKKLEQMFITSLICLKVTMSTSLQNYMQIIATFASTLMSLFQRRKRLKDLNLLRLGLRDKKRSFRKLSLRMLIQIQHSMFKSLDLMTKALNLIKFKNKLTRTINRIKIIKEAELWKSEPILTC